MTGPRGVVRLRRPEEGKGTTSGSPVRRFLGNRDSSDIPLERIDPTVPFSIPFDYL